MGLNTTQSKLAPPARGGTAGVASFGNTGKTAGTGTTFGKEVATLSGNSQGAHRDLENSHNLPESLLPEKSAGQAPPRSFGQRAIKWLKDWTGLSTLQNSRLAKLRSSLEARYGQDSVEQALKEVFPNLGAGDFSLNRATEAQVSQHAKQIDDYNFQIDAGAFFAERPLTGLTKNVDLNWASQFKEDNYLSGVEMMTILKNAAKGGEQLSKASQSTGSEEFLSAMKDFSTSAMGTYRDLSVKAPPGQCKDAQSFLDVYTKALCSMADGSAEGSVNFCGAMRGFLVDMQSEIRVAKKVYDATAATEPGVSLVFLPASKVHNREELSQSLNATSSLCKALNEKQFLSKEAPELQSLYATSDSRKSRPDHTLTDKELMTVGNSGIAVKGQEIADKKGSVSVFPKEILAATKKQLGTMAGKKQHGDTGICGEMYTDLGRADLFLGGHRVSHTASGEREQDKTAVISALSEFCLDTDTGEVNKNMLMAISQVANQGLVHAGPIGSLITGEMPLHRGMILVPDKGCKRDSSYSIEKNDDGDITIECATKFYGGSFMPSGDMMDDSEFLKIDGDNGGFYGYTIKVKLDKASYSKNEGMYPKPQLVDMHYDYNYKMH